MQRARDCGGGVVQCTPSSSASLSLSDSPTEGRLHVAATDAVQHRQPREEAGLRSPDESVLVDAVENGTKRWDREPLRSAAVDLNAGDRLLFLKEDGVTTVSAVFVGGDALPDFFTESDTELDGVERCDASPFLASLAARVLALPSSDVSDAGTRASGGEWSLGWLVGRIPSPTPSSPVNHHRQSRRNKAVVAEKEECPALLVVTSEALDDTTLQQLRTDLGLTFAATNTAAEEEGMRNDDTARFCRQLFVARDEGHSAGGVADPDGVLLSPMRDDDYSDGSCAGTSQRAASRGASPITLDLLVGPRAHRRNPIGAGQRRSPRTGDSFRGHRLPPIALAMCRESCVQPFPSGGRCPSDPPGAAPRLETIACPDAAAAEAAFRYVLQQRLRSRTPGSSPLLRVQQSEFSGVECSGTPSQSTWAYARSEGESTDVTEEWLQLLLDIKERGLTRRSLATVVCFFPMALSLEEQMAGLGLSAPHVLCSTGAVGPRSVAALSLLQRLLPLARCGLTCEVPLSATEEAPRECSELAPLLLLFSTQTEQEAVLAHVSRLAVTAREELEADNKRAQRSVNKVGATACLWNLAAVVDQLASTPVVITAAASAVSQTLQECITVFGGSTSAAVSFAKTALGTACLAASLQPTQHHRQRWFVSEAAELLGCRLGALPPLKSVILSLLRFLTHRVTSCFAREPEPAQGAAAFRVIQAPCTPPLAAEPLESRKPCFFTDAFMEMLLCRTLSRGTVSAVAQQAKAEGVWDGAVKQSLRAALGEEDALVAVSPREKVARALVASLSDPKRTDEVNRWNRMPVEKRFCEQVIATVGVTEASIVAEADGSLQVRTGEGLGCLYSLNELLAPFVGVTQLGADCANVMGSSSSNATVREWLRAREELTVSSFSRGLDVLSNCFPADTYTVVELGRRSTDLTYRGLLPLFQLNSRAYVYCAPIASFCKGLLSLAVRACCCCCDPSGAFTTPPSQRRSFYVHFLQLLAGAQYRDACRLCAREISCCRGLVVGASAVFARRADVNMLEQLRNTALLSATQLLQRAGRGYAARSITCCALHEDARRQQHSAILRAQLSQRMGTYEARDRQAKTLIEHTAVRAASAVAACHERLLSVRAECSACWRETTDVVETELAVAVEEVNDFERSSMRAEYETKDAIRSYRNLLTAEWARQSSKNDTTEGDLFHTRRHHRAPSGTRIGSNGTSLSARGCPSSASLLEQQWEARSLQTEKEQVARSLWRDISLADERRRYAERVVGIAIHEQRARAEQARTAKATAAHLSRQQQRFGNYAVRRDERTELEVNLLAFGSHDTAAAPVTELPDALDNLSGHCTSDGQGRLHAGEKPPKLGTISGNDSALFNCEREKLSWWEDSTICR